MLVILLISAENRVKDKLAHAARDKLAQAKRENQLKAERKRKAAMFINMLKTSQPTSATAKQEETTADSGKYSFCQGTALRADRDMLVMSAWSKLIGTNQGGYCLRVARIILVW